PRTRRALSRRTETATGRSRRSPPRSSFAVCASLEGHDRSRRCRKAQRCARHRAGARRSHTRDGQFSGNGYVVTWAIGHLVALAEPHEMNPIWKKWRLSDLPLLPPRWPLVVAEGTRAQFEVVRRLLVAKETDEIVCATDAGREGELI